MDDQPFQRLLLQSEGAAIFVGPLSSGVYDVYFHGCLHGTAGYEVRGDTVRFENRLDFSPHSQGTMLVEKGRPVYAKLSVAGSTGSEVQVSGDIRKRSGSGFEAIPDSKGLLPYYTTHPYLLKFLLDEYGSKRSGFRSLGAIELSKLKQRPLSVSLDRVETRVIGGAKQTIKTWRVETAPNPESVVYTDGDNRPLEWWAPAINFEMVLRGYESLRPSAPWEGKVSAPAYAVTVEKGVRTSLRDGSTLVADVYRPAASGRYPVILQRTCYDRSEFGDADGEFYASRGYVYVTQNVRGRGGSDGPFEPEEHEAEDGYDSVKWCAGQPWSDGRVGMMGASYNGFCCWMAAKTKPQWLKTMVSVVPMAGAPDGSPWEGGTQYVGSTLEWFGLLRDPMKTQPYNDDTSKAENTLPMSDSDLVQFGHHIPAYQAGIRPDRFDDSVRKGSYRFDLGSVNLPVLHLDGWWNTTGIGTRLNYTRLRQNGSRDQKLVWGPWDHFTNRASVVGDSDAGPQGYMPMQTTILRWFDRWLKGRPNGIDKEPLVSEFVLGANRWVSSDCWPPRTTKGERWYLGADRGLSRAPFSASSVSRFVYDPSKWVADEKLQSSFFFLEGSDAEALCLRPDVVVYESKPLTAPLRLDGPIRGRLYASTSAKDTDWAMALLDVRPDGKAISLASGLVRARYRFSYAHPRLLRPGELAAYDIDMWQTGIQIGVGHRVRLAVLSTLFPDRDRNLNTGEPAYSATRMVVARQTIHQGGGHASYVELPVAPALAG